MTQFFSDGCDVVEERGVRRTVVQTLPTPEHARARARELNADQAQRAQGDVGTFRAAPRPVEGCTCHSGMSVEALGCPVHDV